MFQTCNFIALEHLGHMTSQHWDSIRSTDGDSFRARLEGIAEYLFIFNLTI
jgi:hypothetical protein